MSLVPDIRTLLDEAEAYGIKYGTCDRLRVGCFLYNENDELVAKATNSSIGNLPTCDQEGHLIVNGSCHRTLHAEQSAVSIASIRRKSLQYGTAYLSHMPCLSCAKLLISCGIINIFYKNDYHNVISVELLRELSEKTNVYIGKVDY